MDTPAPKQQKWKKRRASNYTSGSAINTSSVSAMAHGTKGKPVPLGTPIIVGDPQRPGKPNPELVIATKKGVHVEPLSNYARGTKSMPRYGYGTGTMKRTPTSDDLAKRNRPAPPNIFQQPIRVMPAFRPHIVKHLQRGGFTDPEAPSEQAEPRIFGRRRPANGWSAQGGFGF